MLPQLLEISVEAEQIRLQYRGSTDVQPANEVFPEVDFFSEIRHIKVFIWYQVNSTFTGRGRLIQLHATLQHINAIGD